MNDPWHWRNVMRTSSSKPRHFQENSRFFSLILGVQSRGDASLYDGLFLRQGVWISGTSNGKRIQALRFLSTTETALGKTIYSYCCKLLMLWQFVSARILPTSWQHCDPSRRFCRCSSLISFLDLAWERFHCTQLRFAGLSTECLLQFVSPPWNCIWP